MQHAEVTSTSPGVLVRAAGVTEADVDGRACLYSPLSRQVVLLNETATDVWSLCDGSRTAEEVVGLLASSYRADRRAVQEDVHRLLQEMHEAGVLVS